jgi:hypothetical protein
MHSFGGTRAGYQAVNDIQFGKLASAASGVVWVTIARLFLVRWFAAYLWFPLVEYTRLGDLLRMLDRTRVILSLTALSKDC